jgi:CNT family concentrative nucleoside transporter
MVMTGGMAGIAGTVFVLYALLLRPIMPDASGHLMIASLVSAPAALVIARLMVPETQIKSDDQDLRPSEAATTSTMDAIVKGTQAGLELFLSITAMLIVLVALVALCNALLGLLPLIDTAPVSLERILGWIMAPICWLMGIPWSEAVTAGKLMGIKTALNELLAYVELAKLEPQALSERSRLIMTYALCGFANFASLGIMIAGLSSMAPQRRDEIVALGPKSIISGTLSTCLMGALIGILV